MSEKPRCLICGCFVRRVVEHGVGANGEDTGWIRTTDTCSNTAFDHDVDYEVFP